MKVDVRTVDGRVTPGAPARASGKACCVIDLANHNLIRPDLDLRVAFQAKVVIAFNQQFLVDRTMRTMASRAAFTQRRMFIDKRPCLVTMALSARSIESCHGESARRFHDIAPVRIVALHTVNAVLDDGMVVGQIKFRMGFEMTLVTTCRIFSGIDDEFASPASGRNVFAARPMARLATGHAGQLHLFLVKTAVRTARENTRDIGMAFDTSSIPDEGRAFNFRRCDHGSIQGRARAQHQADQTKSSQHEHAARKPMVHPLLFDFMSLVL